MKKYLFLFSVAVVCMPVVAMNNTAKFQNFKVDLVESLAKVRRLESEADSSGIKIAVENARDDALASLKAKYPEFVVPHGVTGKQGKIYSMYIYYPDGRFYDFTSGILYQPDDWLKKPEGVVYQVYDLAEAYCDKHKYNFFVQKKVQGDLDCVFAEDTSIFQEILAGQRRRNLIVAGCLFASSAILAAAVLAYYLVRKAKASKDKASSEEEVEVAVADNAENQAHPMPIKIQKTLA